MLAKLAEEVARVNRTNGWTGLSPESWKDDHAILAYLFLIDTELAEAGEAFRVNDLAHFIEEIADVQIRLLDLAGGLGIDLDRAVADKLEKNRARGFHHGGKKRI